MSEDWKLDKRGAVLLHQQIYDFVKGKIRSGEWPVGMRIPSQRELAAALAVNRSTVVHALGELAADGLVEPAVGRGTVVANSTWNLLAGSRQPDWGRYVRSGAYRPNQSLIRRINEAEPDPGLIRLGTGELSPELLPSSRIAELLAGSVSGPLSLGYPEPKGSYPLREALSSYMKRKGIAASPSSILIVSGALQGLQLISLGLLRPGSVILAENPTYLNSVHVFQSAGMDLRTVPMDDDGIRPDAVGRLMRQHGASLLYANPTYHNPTGGVMSLKRRESLMQACAEARLPVVEDDAYGDLWLDEPPPSPLKSLDSQGLVLHMGSMSKSLGPGLRIGWIAGPEPVIERLADIKMQTDYGSSTLSQHAVAEWLAAGCHEEHLSFLRGKLRERRAIALAALEASFADLADWTVPRGGFYIWLRLRKPVDMRRLFELALQAGVLLNPGSIYDREDRQHLRLSYSYASLSQLEEGLAALSSLIRSLTAR